MREGDPVLELRRSASVSPSCRSALRAAALLILGGMSACLSPPRPINDEPELKNLQGRTPFAIAVAPMSFAGGLDSGSTPSSRRAPDQWNKEPDPEDLSLFEQAAEQVLSRCFGATGGAADIEQEGLGGRQVVFLGREALDTGFNAESGEASANPPPRLLRDCQRAEQLGLPLLLDLSITENSLTAEGPELLSSLGEWAAMWFFPAHWLVPNEAFQQKASLKVRLFNVRNPRTPLFEVEVSASDRRILSEVEHGLVLLNTFRWLFNYESAGQRYADSDWREVYRSLRPQVLRKLQLGLARELNGPLRRVFDEAGVERALTEGTEDESRCFVVVVGHDPAGQSQCQHAQDDALAFYETLERQPGELRRQHTLILGEKATEPRVLETLRRLPTRRVDQVLFYFSGQGLTTESGKEALLLADGAKLELSKIREALLPGRAQEVLFILDTSFGGGPDQARDRGRRTAAGSRSGPVSAEGYLEDLRKSPGGDARWNLVCAARPGEVTGELDGHGIFTGLILELGRSLPLWGMDWAALGRRLAEDYRKRCEAWLGAPTLPHSSAPEGIQFLLPQVPPNQVGGSSGERPAQ